MAKLKKPVSEEEARLKMADLCARSEQCEYDISQKLFRMGMFSDQRTRIIGFLRTNNFIDDFRFARSYARDKCRFSRWGPYKIQQGLKAKRIPNDIISSALDEVEEEDWDEALSRATATKAKSLPLLGNDNKENRIKLARFLLSRGFAYDDVKEAVKEAARKQKEEENDETA